MSGLDYVCMVCLRLYGLSASTTSVWFVCVQRGGVSGLAFVATTGVSRVRPVPSTRSRRRRWPSRQPGSARPSPARPAARTPLSPVSPLSLLRDSDSRLAPPPLDRVCPHRRLHQAPPPVGAPPPSCLARHAPALSPLSPARPALLHRGRRGLTPASELHRPIETRGRRRETLARRAGPHLYGPEKLYKFVCAGRVFTRRETRAQPGPPVRCGCPARVGPSGLSASESRDLSRPSSKTKDPSQACQTYCLG